MINTSFFRGGVILSLAILLFSYVPSNAACIEPFVHSVQPKSESCPHGEMWVAWDSDGDGKHDQVTYYHCDGSKVTNPMKMVGEGNALSNEMNIFIRFLDGDFSSESHVIEFYTDDDPEEPGGETNIGYFVKEAGLSYTTFYYNGYYKP